MKRDLTALEKAQGAIVAAKKEEPMSLQRNEYIAVATAQACIAAAEAAEALLAQVKAWRLPGG